MLTKNSHKLTHEGAHAVSEAAAKKAAEMKLPICIAVIGGIGISAGTEAQDEEIARAGLEALR